MKILKIIFHIFIFIILTILTQIGGIIYLLSFTTHSFINKKFQKPLVGTLTKSGSFILLYLIFTFLIVPIIAKPFGRVALPITETTHLRPLTFLTCLLNRHYVKPELKEASINVAIQMNEMFPNTTINYLDANFPFINKFPLLPHLSHNDGQKLDLAFCYIDKLTNKATKDCPSFIGYGICEEPKEGEVNTAEFCREKGYWQYSILKTIISQSNKNQFIFDEERTKELVNLCAKQLTIKKIFIEPHLKARFNLTSSKIRFHGCKAVRHDDHIHVQL